MPYQQNHTSLFSSPKEAAPAPAPAPPTQASASTAAANDAAIQSARANASGYSSTIMTSGEGVTQDPNNAKKVSLLGE